MTSKPHFKRLWQTYRAASLSQQFVYEWMAFGVLCVWAFIVLILAVTL